MTKKGWSEIAPGASTDSKIAVTPLWKVISACVIPGPRMCGIVLPATADTRTALPNSILNGRSQCSPPSKTNPSGPVQMNSPGSYEPSRAHSFSAGWPLSQNLARAVRTSPMAPSAMRRRAVTTSCQYCEFSATINTLSEACSLCAAMMRSPEATDTEIGFSRSTWRPARRASHATRSWRSPRLGTMTSTAWKSSPSGSDWSASVRLSKARGAPPSFSSTAFTAASRRPM
mmetsp:Transcript_69165/g.205849  ORF Transcript_69165/g.205849 Transcript_69165/m.205849 type:complete len:230 (-) Transcript_69165:58-747(-)